MQPVSQAWSATLDECSEPFGKAVSRLNQLEQRRPCELSCLAGAGTRCELEKSLLCEPRVQIDHSVEASTAVVGEDEYVAR